MSQAQETSESERPGPSEPSRWTLREWAEERTTLYFGDIVLARTGKSNSSNWWIARIDFVNPKLCTTRKQNRTPNLGTINGTHAYDYDFKWPVFFYGTHETMWLSEKDQIKRLVKKEQVPEFNADWQYSNSQHEKALFEWYTNPWVCQETWGDVKGTKFSTPVLRGWLAEEAPHCDVIPDYWLNNIRKVKKEQVNVVEEDKEKDAIQKEYKQALFKVKDMELGDMVGAAYPKNDKFEYYYYEGLVKEINADKTMVVVHFSRFCRGTGEYVAEKKDTDNIEEARQGYVYFHLKKENIDVKAPTSRKDEVFKVNDPNIAETLRAAQLNWKLKVAQISEDEEAIKLAHSELNLLESQKVVLNYASGTRKRTRQDAKF